MRVDSKIPFGPKYMLPITFPSLTEIVDKAEPAQIDSSNW